MKPHELTIPTCRVTRGLILSHCLLFSVGFFMFTRLTAQTFTRVTEGHIVTSLAPSIGCAWADYDLDGDLDLFVANYIPGFNDLHQYDGKNFLYRNDGNAIFTLCSAGDIATDLGNSRGAVWGDYDHDGLPDLYVANVQGVNHLYRNNGDGSFSRIVEGDAVQEEYDCPGASWADIDNDGDLDLFTTNEQAFSGNRLYRNDGAGMLIADRDNAIVGDLIPGGSWGSAWSDFDLDGDMDLFVTNFLGNNGHVNSLYANNGNGNFSKVTSGPVVEDTFNSVGASWGDYDNDGDPDLFVANTFVIGASCEICVGPPNNVYRNDGNESFTGVEAGAVTHNPVMSRGSSWADFDNDGDLDLFVSDLNNGDLTISDGVNRLYVNDGNGLFSGHDLDSGTSSFGCAAADYDNDGDIDLFVANGLSILGPQPQQTIEENVLLTNDGNANHWVNINCVGLASPVPVLGTKVRAKAVIGGVPVWQLREITSQTGLYSQNSQRVHFGLGDAEIIDSLKVEWPSGNIDVYTGVAINTFYKAVQGAGLNPIVSSVNISGSALPAAFELKENYPNPFNPTTTITFAVPRAGEVTLAIYNLRGQLVRTLVSGPMTAGEHSIVWDAKDDQGLKVASGMYVYQLKAQDFLSTKRMMLMK